MFALLNEIAEKYKAQAVDFCQRLIRIPSISGDEEAVADLYIAEMEKLGYDQVFRDDWGNVVGIIKGDEPGPTIMFNCHLDHVDVGDPSEWGGYDPYGAEIDVAEAYNQDNTAEELTEVVHGRAASDTKGGGATQVYAGAALLELRKQGYKLKGKYMFTAVVLEEPAEQLGMIKLIDETFPEKDLDYDCVVSAEATSLKLYLGHRGKMEILVTVYGRTSHGSSPWLGINAVNKATKLTEKIENELVKTFPSDPDLGRASIALTNITCTPGALAIVPDRCYLTYDRRMHPDETTETCVQEIQDLIDQIASEDPDFKADVSVKTTLRTSYTGKQAAVPCSKEAWKISQEHPVVESAAKALEEIGQEVKFGYWDFGTDLSKVCFTDGKPAIGYSPMQELYCHRPIDRVRTDYMEKSIAGNAAIFLKLMELSPDELEEKLVDI